MATANEPDSQAIGDECSICLVPLSQPGLDKYTTACQHQFHFQCLAKNIQARNNECPLCRTHLDSLVNILNASANTTTPTPLENIAVQQAAPIQQAVPIQATQTQQVTSTETPPLNTSTGVWKTLTQSFSNAFGWLSSSASNTSQPSTTQKKKTSSWRFSKHSAGPEDLVDERAVRVLSGRINAARQQSTTGRTEFSRITATTTLEYGAQESTKESNIYGMVTLKAPALLADTATEKELDELHVPIDLVCVVDRSGSMQGDKISLLKDTLEYIINQMGVLDRLSIITFSSSAQDQSKGLKLMTAENKETLVNIVKREIGASGGTFIGSGLEMAIELLRNRKTTNPLGAMLLLTDGQDNTPQDYSALMEMLPEGVVCHTFGYGAGHNAALLSSIAEQGHAGTFTYIDQADAIGPAFATALGGLFTCIAKQIRVKLEFNDGYQITHTHSVYKHEPDSLPSRQIVFRMTDLNADETRNLVFQLNVPNIRPSDEENTADDHTIGQVSLEYRDANTDQLVQTPPVPFTLARPNQINPQSPLLQVNYALDIQRNRAETSAVLKQAIAENNYTRARELINAQLEKIRASVSAADPLCQQLIRDLEYRHANQFEFNKNMTNMWMQHGQERATYSTCATTSTIGYLTSGQERYRQKYWS